MTLQLSVKLTGDRKYRKALRRASPKLKPEFRRIALEQGGAELIKRIALELQGPRPRRLDVDTGKTLRSLRRGVDRTGLPNVIRVGPTGRERFWLALYETGSRGRSRRFRPRRPFIQPGIEAALPELGDIFERAWKAQIRKGSR